MPCDWLGSPSWVCTVNAMGDDAEADETGDCSIGIDPQQSRRRICAGGFECRTAVCRDQNSLMRMMIALGMVNSTEPIKTHQKYFFSRLGPLAEKLTAMMRRPFSV